MVGALHLELLGLRQALDDHVQHLAGAPFTDVDRHPVAVRVTADALQWTAELDRASGGDDPELWQCCARSWAQLGRSHRAAYAWWRTAEALLQSRAGAQDAIRALGQGHDLADGFQPLRQRIEQTARRARLPLPSAAGPDPDGQQRSDDTDRQPVDPYGLSVRERQVLALLAAGRSNAQIGAELYMSPKTASVHVTHILRKLGVENRTHAATVAERAGLTTEPTVEPGRR